ncbi:hypothetical protein Sru01_63790 [Sphaerisporangium rufum]|uniref:Uncharacterized protein n=1 Tax=Sphaerisporangium rufum TaxID=1381558 RepID=A0A919RCD3_9ACTN|nr:hypothetical protein [Sphaerisporangium rufum]GII81397.1 hypothetical protein Sru01_63790 [Sphaerisporangium rufum]
MALITVEQVRAKLLGFETTCRKPSWPWCGRPGGRPVNQDVRRTGGGAGLPVPRNVGAADFVKGTGDPYDGRW